MWGLPGPGIKPVPPALAGGFITTLTGPPGQKRSYVLGSAGSSVSSIILSLNAWGTGSLHQASAHLGRPSLPPQHWRLVWGLKGGRSPLRRHAHSQGWWFLKEYILVGSTVTQYLAGSCLTDRKSTRLNSSHKHRSRMPSSA